MMHRDPPSASSAAEILRLLLVEDDPDDVLLLREMLEEVPGVRFQVVHAGTMEETLARLREEQFHVILLDLTLPDSQGFDTFRTLKAAGVGAPIVVLTGLDDETLALSAVQEGAQDYLVKGRVDGDLLVRSIRYAIERQRTSHYRALITERQRFDAAISQMSDGILVADGDWRVQSANRAACLLLDLPPGDWTGRTLREVLDRFTLSLPHEQLLESSERVTAFDIARPDTDPPLFIDARLSRLTDTDGRLVSALLMVRDVTEERRNANVKAHFLSLVPHKVRTPLTVLQGYLDLCKRLPLERLRDEWTDIIDACLAEARRLSDLLQTLLDFKMLELRQLEAEAGCADLAEVIAERDEWLRARYPAKQLHLTTDLSPEATLVGASAAHIGLILEKLLDNAAKFADKEPVEIRVRSEPVDSGWVRVSVTDNGPGIPHEYHDRVFREFVQVEDKVTGAVPGLGVGLGMAKQLVEVYGGTIALRSRLHQGCTVSFTLPTPA